VEPLPPPQTHSEQQTQEQTKAATVLNNQGDGRGRSRMRPDMTPMPELPPRGGVLSTGEDCVQRRSAQGRSLIVKFTPEVMGKLGWQDTGLRIYVSKPPTSANKEGQH
jgi:hypothetical protein